MARTPLFHSKHGIGAELKNIVAELKGVATEFKTAFEDARQHPTVKAFAHEAGRTAADVKAVMQNVREDVKLVFKAAGEQISAIFKDAGERLAAVHEQVAPQAMASSETEAQTACDRGGVHAGSDEPIDAVLTGVTAADAMPVPVHG